MSAALPAPNRLNRWPHHMGYTSQSNHGDLKPRQRSRAINNRRSKTHGESTLELFLPKAAPSNTFPSVSERNRQRPSPGRLEWSLSV